MRNVRFLLATLALRIASAPTIAETFPSSAQPTSVANDVFPYFAGERSSGPISATPFPHRTRKP